MRYLTAILLYISLFLVKAQSISGNFSFPAEKYSAENYDTSIQNVYYKLEFISDPKSSNKKEVNCILEIGNKFSRFSELNGIKLDSLIEKFSHQETVGAKEVNQMMQVNTRWKTVIVRNIDQSSLIIQDKVKDNYQYTEKQPSFNWKLENEAKDILGYNCKKATTDFRGRKYTAWYTSDIPINNGPFIFNGLPGLMMEIEDKKGHYHFTAIALDKKSYPIYLRNENKIFKVSREKFREIQKTYADNPAVFLPPSYDSNGNEIKDKVKSKPYNPIELE
jgi:GLPGLI family protein